MSDITLQKSEKGWIIELPDEFSDELGVEHKSIGILQVKNGQVEVEVMPPASAEIKEAADRIFDKYEDVFTELKRIGD